MKIRLVKVPILLVMSITLFLPTITSADQTDTRLDALFEVLQKSIDKSELQEAESNIWQIWYESGQQDIDLLMEQASELAQAGELDLAESIYTEVIEMAPDFSEGWNRRATIRYYRKDYDGSLEDIHRTLVLEPRHFGAVWGLGMILGWQRNFDDAIIAFERLLELKPHSSDAEPRIEILKQELAKSAV